ncbi:MAG TPA: hypothetical protein VJZ06_02500 [Mobilitalea sp.]|nr:hypothetical protein [Mobilitalea sp.]
MDGNNLLSGGLEELNVIKENILELNGYQVKHENLVSDEQKLEKSIQVVEKTVTEEIASTTKKRRQEIEDAFDKQMDKTESRIKKIKDKRDKSRDRKVSERISEETAYLKEENNRLKLEAKTVFKQKHVPSYCNTRLFYALYFPKHPEDILIIFCTLLLTLLIIPCSIYFFALPVERILYLILIYIAIVIFFGGIYLLIGNHTKDKHPDDMKQVRGLRSQLRINNKKIKVIKSNISKDRDDSTYGLENFDDELAKLNQEEADIAEQKKEALLAFDNTTYQVIAAEIKGRSEEKLVGLKTEYEKINGECSLTHDRIKALTIRIASEYEPYIGKDLMTLDRLEALSNIIQAGNAATISEAVAFHKQNMTKA